MHPVMYELPWIGISVPALAVWTFESGNFLFAPMEPGTILEVKYDAFLPELVRMAVQVPGRQAAACSKYALCRRFD